MDRLPPERIEWVRQQLGCFMRAAVLTAKVGAKFGVKDRQARSYIKAARDEIRQGNEVNRPERRAEMRNTLETLAQAAIANGEIGYAISAVRELIGLDGVAEPDRVEISGALQTEPDPQKAMEQLAEILARPEGK
jgi:hypothetical protein